MAAVDGLGDGKVIGVRVDVSDRQSCDEMAAAAVEAFGGLDVLCANAGIFPDAPLATIDTRAAQRDHGRQRQRHVLRGAGLLWTR